LSAQFNYLKIWETPVINSLVSVYHLARYQIFKYHKCASSIFNIFDRTG